MVDADAFHDLFLPGPRTFGNPAMGGQGVALTYTDANGQRWPTTCGHASQTGAQFQLLERATEIDGLGPKARVVATFQCTFHNGTTGEARPVLNGGPVLEFRDF